MTGLIFVVYFALFANVVSGGVDYLNKVCDLSNVYVSTSRRLESSTALYYANGVSCFYHVKVPAGKQVLLLVSHFYLESEVKNACVDFVNIHDGSSVSDVTLNASPLCAQAASKNYTSTGTDMTVYFHTDSSGVRRGFEFIFVAITTGTCGSDQFSCNTSVCIDSSLKCNIYNECGDNSDESSCTATAPYTYSASSQAGLIAGLTVGMFALVLVGVVIGYWVWRNNRWRIFNNRPIMAKEIVHDETTFVTTYPVTKVYYKDRIQDLYRNPQHPQIIGHDEVAMEKKWLTKQEEVNKAYTE